MHISRRRFIAATGFGALALAAGSWWYRRQPGTSQSPGFLLQDQERAALQAIAPVLLSAVLTHDPAPRAAQIDAVLDAVHVAVNGLAPVTQREVQDLFGLLAIGPVRRLLAGVPTDWQHASPDQIASFLQSWRMHRLGLLRSGYQALHDLVLGAWYAQPASWGQLGYPGPIAELA